MSDSHPFDGVDGREPTPSLGSQLDPLGPTVTSVIVSVYGGGI
jgi:hypothetical protein